MITESVDIMKQYRVYPHERFALRRLPAGTVTSTENSKIIDDVYDCIEECPYLNGSLKSDNMDMILFKRNIQFIAEVLAHYMFDLKDSSLVRRLDCY